MRHRRPLIGLTVFMVSALAVTWMVFVTLRRDVTGPTNSYSAIFTDVSGLHPGDDVRVAGVRVGRVDKVQLQGTSAKVTFRVQKDQVLYTNTVASVTYQNIIGQRHLGLSAGLGGDGTALADGAQMPLEHTKPSFDISYLLNGFQPLFAVLDPAQVDNLTNGIVQALQGDSGSILALITQTSALAESFAGPDQVLDGVITNLNDVATDLAAQSASLENVIGQTRDVLADLNSRRASLVASMGSISATVQRLAAITSAIFPDLQQLIDRQPGFTAHVIDDQDRFAYFGANLPYLLKGLARVTQAGSYIDAYACNINTTIFAFLGRLIPAVVRLASPGNVIRQSPICR